MRTDCYHYYHPPCLSRYVKFCEQQRREEDEEQRRTGQNRWSAGSKPKSVSSCISELMIVCIMCALAGVPCLSSTNHYFLKSLYRRGRKRVSISELSFQCLINFADTTHICNC